MKLITQSLLVTLLLLAGYAQLLNHLPPHLLKGGGVGTWNEQNLMVAQEFCYDSSRPDVVVLGSSISHPMSPYLPQGWYNLSLIGGNVFTGAEILLAADKVPPCVVIETNVLIWEADRSLIDTLFDPRYHELRRRLPLLKETHKPLHLVMRALDPHENTPGEKADATGFEPQEIQPDDPLYAQMRQRRADELATPLDSAKLDALVARLEDIALRLESRGAHLFFYESPEDAQSMALPRPVSIRQRLQEVFPPSRYRWVPPVDPHDYRTTDFIHLTPTSSARYARHLVAYVTQAQHAKHQVSVVER